MGLGSSRNRMESDFPSDPDSNFVSIRVDDSDEETRDRLVPIIRSPNVVVQEQEDHLAQVPIFHSPDVVQGQEDHLALVCPICLINAKDVAFGCGHVTCGHCSSIMSICPICRERITSRLRVFIN